ncbi:MAG: pyruvate, phosphate dikinase [candidate division Zixibacteria bacterium]|nr:pyruvate, phosphate dikinase [candidate division Zixibacteria bacterium]
MDEQKKQSDDLLWFLQERAKELNCLYKIEEILSNPDLKLDEVCSCIIEAIPPGWQFPDVCIAEIEIENQTYHSPNFKETKWFHSCDIEVQDKAIGKIAVYYTAEMPSADDGPFLFEETKLLKTIAERLGHSLMYRRMKKVFHDYSSSHERTTDTEIREWRVAYDLLRQTDRNLLKNISQRMLDHLCWSGVEEAENLLQNLGLGKIPRNKEIVVDENVPREKSQMAYTDSVCGEIFEIAGKHLWDENILAFIRKWIQEDKLSFLTRLISQNLPLAEVVDAVRRYTLLASDDMDLPSNTKKMVSISLIRRMLFDRKEYINIAKDNLEVEDFSELLNHVIYPPESHGKLGGKSAGLFLARKIVEKAKEHSEQLGDIKVPRSWHITSDTLLDFLQFNNLSTVIEQKYKDLNQVRFEYPHIIQTFKNCQFPPDILKELSLALDGFGDKPLIVRSSSLLEDRAGSAFSGKYKSLFLANQGSKPERLDALTDAIAEVYASIFGPDPIEYRAERGLLDFLEEMGIIIQEVVGNKIGDYFLPTYAGVALSRNEFRWSPRIKREDGLVRIVPGLGTRAVDRTGDDYPILIAPGQAGLQVNVTPDEMVRYTPKMIDIINLKTNSFETLPITKLFKEFGKEIPGIDKVVSVFQDQYIRKTVGSNIDFKKDDLIATFQGLIGNTQFIKKIKCLLGVLEEKLGTPVDIEFASDGKDFYLLQCRPQCHSEGEEPAPIPKDVPKENILFSANRYISNGRVSDISHIVYVDPQAYDELNDPNDLIAVGRAVGNLNKLLPKRQFILMGPGRWGSRGDIKLGVRVTYSDISNTAVLVEIARKKGSYVPDLSFGTHFFQDLVEAEIRYVPLYPDDEGIIFNENFLRKSENILSEVLPEFTRLENTIRLIDIPKNTNNRYLRILLNADLDEALAVLAKPSTDQELEKVSASFAEVQTENYWAWRLQMAENIASQIDPQRFSVENLYIFGSTKNATAGPGSDIDIIVHFRGTEKQQRDLLNWLEGWSLALDEMNYLRTGYRSGGLLDVHIVTDEDIANKTSYASKIGAITDAARPLTMNKK